MNMEEMKVNALLMNSTDNVVTTVAEIAKGENVCFMKGSETRLRRCKRRMGERPEPEE